MLVGVVSDTHDRLPMIDAALALFAQRRVEAVIHPGDFVAPFAVRRLLCYNGPLHATYGNNDGERAGIKELMPHVVDGPLCIELGGRKILVHHFIGWCEAKDIAWADIVVTGHTHEVVNETKEGPRADGVGQEADGVGKEAGGIGRLFLNPGECCGWVTGRCTVAILDTDGPTAQICDLET